MLLTPSGVAGAWFRAKNGFWLRQLGAHSKRRHKLLCELAAQKPRPIHTVRIHVA